MNKRNNVYYLFRDILSCFPTRFEDNFLSIINYHLIAKETSRQILLDEVKEKKPNFRILYGALILQNAFLMQTGRAAVYEVIDVAEAIKICLTKIKIKTIKRLATEVTLRLFVSIYFEYVILPGRKEEGKEFIDRFKKYFSRNDIMDAMNSYRLFRFIFERQGIQVGYGAEGETRLNEMMSNFYGEN